MKGNFRFKITCFAFLILFFCFKSDFCLAETALIEISHQKINDNTYQINFMFAGASNYIIAPSQDKKKLSLKFLDTKYQLKKITNKKLDQKFLTNISRTTKNDSNLTIILNLSPNSRLLRKYSTIEQNIMLVTVEIRNDLSIPILKNASDIRFKGDLGRKTEDYIKAYEHSNIEKDLPRSFIKKNPSLKTRKLTIVIDPGHGGIDIGAVGTNLKLIEKNITLAYARELKRELIKYPNYNIFLTRESDKFLTLEQRKNIARSLKADLFISLHADTNPDPKIHGASVYTLSQKALEQESDFLSEQENKNEILKNGKLLDQHKNIADILIDMVYQDSKNASVSLAKYTSMELSKEVTTLDKSNRQAGFKILKLADIPAVLIELGYLSNMEEEELLNSYNHKKIFIQALVQGVNKYAENWVRMNP